MRSINKLFLILMMATTLSHADVLLKGTQGQEISFASLKGKWVLINYWASWCTTCIAEIPEFNQFYRKHENKSVALFAVNYDALPASKQTKLIKKFNIQYPSLLVDPAFALGLGDITGVPVTFVFNPEGTLVSTLYGGQAVHDLEQAIAMK